MTLRMLLLSCALASAGCALLGKNDPVVPRYFTPQYESEGNKAPGHPELRLRLGRISAWAHLRERMVVRSSPQELIYAEDRRWTERPEVYLRAALERTLFEERGLVEALTGGAPTLEVELAAFEEVPKPKQHVRLQALVLLHDDRSGRMEETLTVEEPVAAGPDTDVAVVEALSRALHRGVDEISDHVVVKLTSLRAAANKAEQ